MSFWRTCSSSDQTNIIVPMLNSLVSCITNRDTKTTYKSWSFSMEEEIFDTMYTEDKGDGPRYLAT